jgi:DNA-directed RNA polymerase beta subunit
MPTKKTTKKTPVSATTVQNELPAVFQKCFQKDGRIYLNTPKNFESYPDLLALQKKGYKDFIEKYIHALFEDINPIRDIAGEKMFVMISDIKISEPQQDIDECKKKELTYG